jgi:hypothetical protein
VVDLAGEHPTELCGAEAFFEGGDLGFDLGDDAFVFLRHAELEELLRVVDVSGELLRRLDALLDRRTLPRDRLGLLRIVPEPRGERGLVEAFDVSLQLRDVKDAPLAS